MVNPKKDLYVLVLKDGEFASVSSIWLDEDSVLVVFPNGQVNIVNEWSKSSAN